MWACRDREAQPTSWKRDQGKRELPSTPFLFIQSQPHYPSHRLFALPVLYAFMQAIPSAWNAIHCLLPFHHSLLFPMKSFRVQLKCHHLSILKFALTPFHVGMVHCPFLCLYFVYCMVSQLSFGQLTKWILLNFRANVFLYAAVSTVHLSHSGIIFFYFGCASHPVMSDILQYCGLYSPPGLFCPWNSTGKEYWSHFLLPGIFPIQGSNPGCLHCRQILYHLSHQGSPTFWI